MENERTQAQPDWLEQIDHTADAGIVVSAGDLKELFARAAWGMFSVITDMSAVRPHARAQISVEAEDRQGLLVKWLSELNYRHITKHQLFCSFRVLELSDSRLEAEVQGERIDPSRHMVYTEIKAVTFHGLEIEQRDGRWRAQIIFDL